MLIYDLETTGFAAPQICEIAVFCANTHHSFITLVKPEKTISQEATKVHQIRGQRVSKSPTFGDVVQQLEHWVEQIHDHTSIVWLAHSTGNFDYSVLNPNPYPF